MKRPPCLIMGRSRAEEEVVDDGRGEDSEEDEEEEYGSEYGSDYEEYDEVDGFKAAYDPPKRVTFKKECIDYAKMAIEKYNNFKGTDYSFVGLIKAYYCEIFMGMMYDITFKASSPVKGDQIFEIRVGEGDNGIFGLDKVEEIKLINDYGGKVLYEPPKTKNDDALPKFIRCSKIAVDEYNKDEGMNYGFVSLVKAVGQDAGGCTNWLLYTLTFKASLPDKNCETFCAKVLFGGKKNGTSATFVMDVELIMDLLSVKREEYVEQIKDLSSVKKEEIVELIEDLPSVKKEENVEHTKDSTSVKKRKRCQQQTDGDDDGNMFATELVEGKSAGDES